MLQAFQGNVPAFKLRTILLPLLGCVFLGLIGCEPPPKKLEVTETSGIVLYKGKPVDCGVVVFESRTTGHASSGIINPDGTFTVPKVVAGDYIVGIMGPQAPPPGSDIPLPFISEQNRKIFEKYGDPNTSGLKATITADGSTTLRFELPEIP